MVRPEWYFRFDQDAGACHRDNSRQKRLATVAVEILDGGCVLYRLPTSTTTPTPPEHPTP